MPNIAEQLAHADRAYIKAPAGYGKTFLIAQAVTYCNNGKELILTHTHAGVRSIQEKLKSMGVSTKKYDVDTIAGWCLRLTMTFPFLSGLSNFSPMENDEWNSIYPVLIKLLENSSIKKIIKSTYHGIYVDEYQDCNCRQHQLILVLANLLPCRILGDDLQGIFDFSKNDPLINWRDDVETQFLHIGDLTKPWRWINANNAALGTVLLQLREALESSQPFNLQQRPITWVNYTYPNQINWCRRFLRNNTESVVAIQSLPNQCNYFARQLQGKYGVMESLNCQDLFKAAIEIETLQGFSRALYLIEFASKCMTQIKDTLKPTISAFEKGKFSAVSDKTTYPVLVNALNQVICDYNLLFVANTLPLFCKISNSYLYRRELWYEFSRSIKVYLRGGFDTLKDAAWNIRNITREQGRYLDHRTISRTLLIKGLEFDHVIILNADSLDKKNLYVAMTRGTKSLTVLSSNPIIQK